MTQTPSELLAPYKAPLIEAARALLRAAGTDGMAIDIPASVPPAVIVLGAADRVSTLLRDPSADVLPGGRRAGDPPPAPLSWEEPMPGAPRKWTILLTSEGCGLVGKLGSTFESAHERHERLDVVELGPFVHQLASAIEQNAQQLQVVQALQEQVAELKRQLASVQKDAERLEFMAEHEAWIAWGQDAERCRVFHRTDEGDNEPIMGWSHPNAWHEDPRAAVDAALAHQTGAQEGGAA